MKALILDKEDDGVVVLREDGEVLTVNSQGDIGESIELDDENKKASANSYLKGIMLSVAMFFMVIFATGSYRYYCVSPVAYVSMDVNPSVEYVLNRQGNVIEVNALNSDGESIVKEYNEKSKSHCSLSSAVVSTTNILYDNRYLRKSKNYILVNVSSDNIKNQKQIETQVQEAIDERKDTSINLYVTEATTKEHTKAKKLGLSTGRYVMMEKIYKGDKDYVDNDDEDISEEMVENCANDSVFNLLSSSGCIKEDTSEGETILAEDSKNSKNKLDKEKAKVDDKNLEKDSSTKGSEKATDDNSSSMNKEFADKNSTNAQQKDTSNITSEDNTKIDKSIKFIEGNELPASGGNGKDSQSIFSGKSANNTTTEDQSLSNKFNKSNKNNKNIQQKQNTQDKQNQQYGE